MGIESISLSAIRDGRHTTPAEEAVARVVGGPWQPKGKKLFRRNQGETPAAWRRKVLESATAVQVLLPRRSRQPPRPPVRKCAHVRAGGAARAARAVRAEFAAPEA